ncbi:hypothetical protein K438DRAFT_2027725 [Mycena galopus ATCC 62051]|nr:hypothetical protein K438DRAFT_2027725 [Mycena galopus ATCC 62051]
MAPDGRHLIAANGGRERQRAAQGWHWRHFTKSRLIPAPDFHPPPRFYGEVIAGSGDHWLTVFCADTPWLQSIFRASSQTPQSVHTAIVDTEVEADLTVILDISSSVAFARSAHPKSALEEPIARHTGQRICGALPASDALCIVAVIESASHFYHHLRRVAPPMEMESNCEIHRELHALVDTHGDGVLSGNDFEDKDEYAHRIHQVNGALMR